MRLRRGLLLLALAAGCGSGSDPAELEPSDHRYRAFFDAAARAEEAPMLLRFEARKGWHIVPDATAHLELAAPEGFELLRAVQQGPDALEHSEEALVFALELRPLASGAEAEAPIRGSVKFGVCRDDATACEIVRRDLALVAHVPGP